MYSPPAAIMDAVDPVAVQTHIPLDQTLNQSRAASPANRKGASSIEEVSLIDRSNERNERTEWTERTGSI